MTGPPSEFVVPRRFRGPAISGNGGWTAGALATLLVGHAEAPQPPVRVRLSAPPPLETPMVVTRDGEVATATAGGRVVAAATLLDDAEAAAALQPVPPVAADVAAAAAAGYRGLRDHPFPECFSCGTARAPGDGLRLFPGPVDGVDAVVAAAWTPHESLADEPVEGPADGQGDAEVEGEVEGEVAGRGRVPVPVLWAALDCPGGWAVDLTGRPMVLGTMTAWVGERPRIGEPLVVVGRVLDVSDRTARTATTLYRATSRGTGRALAVAAHVWVRVDPTTFGATP